MTLENLVLQRIGLHKVGWHLLMGIILYSVGFMWKSHPDLRALGRP